MEKKMTKKRSINLIICLSILLIIGIVASCVSFTLPFRINGNYYHYSCFIDELVLGADVSDGVIISYRASLPDDEPNASYDDYMHNTMLGLEDILSDAGYKDSHVTKVGEDKISLTVGNIVNDADKESVISLLGNPGKLKFSSESSASSSGEKDFAGKYVKNVSVKSQNGNNETLYYVDIQLNEDGKKLMADLSQYIVDNSGTLYMYLGDTAISSNTLDSAILDGHLTMYSEDNFIDKASTQQYVTNIKTGLLDLDLTQLEARKITAFMGHRMTMWVAIAMVVLIALSFIYLIASYRELGVMAVFNSLFYIVISLGLIQAIPFEHLNYSGILALGIGYLLSVYALVSICDRAKNEFKSGKKLHTCFKLAQKKSLYKILISNVFMFVSGVICALMPTLHVQSFGMVILVMSLVNIFCSLVLFRVMLKLYSALNFYKGERCNFKVEEEAKNAK